MLTLLLNPALGVGWIGNHSDKDSVPQKWVWTMGFTLFACNGICNALYQHGDMYVAPLQVLQGLLYLDAAGSFILYDMSGCVWYHGIIGTGSWGVVTWIRIRSVPILFTTYWKICLCIKKRLCYELHVFVIVLYRMRFDNDTSTICVNLLPSNRNYWNLFLIHIVEVCIC